MDPTVLPSYDYGLMDLIIFPPYDYVYGLHIRPKYFKNNINPILVIPFFNIFLELVLTDSWN